MRLPTFLLLSAAVALAGCQKNDPNSVEDQLRIVTTGKTIKEKEKAVENLRAIGKPEAAPQIAAALKEAPPKIRAKLAIVLGELKNPAAVPALSDAIDFGVGEGTDPTTQDTNTANKEIARALGDIGDKAGTKALVQLLKSTKNNYVRIDAITSLGKLKDPAAVQALMGVAVDERLETFINKKAVLALAEINSPEALPAYLRMLFAERRGVSFYPESAFAIFKLGNAANDRILGVLKGEDKELLDWAKERGVLTPAIYGKAAQIEADLQDKRAVPELIKLLKYEDENPAYKLIVRMNAADSLGRMRAKEGVAPIAAQLTEEEANTRGAYVRALVQIGEKSALPKLVDCAKKGTWSARDYCAMGIALLGTDKEIKVLEGLIKDEPGRFDAECKDGMYGEVDCVKEKAKYVDLRMKALNGYKTALTAVSSCTDDKCLEAALDHSEPGVRERAAYELGRRLAVNSVPTLVNAIKREVKDVVDLNPRFAAICAVDWIASGSPDGLAKAKPEAAALDQLVETEKEKVLTQKIAEEVKRLAIKLQR